MYIYYIKAEKNQNNNQINDDECFFIHFIEETNWSGVGYLTGIGHWGV